MTAIYPTVPIDDRTDQDAPDDLFLQRQRSLSAEASSTAQVESLSPWTLSKAKCCFDILAVVLIAPLFVPVFLAVAFVVLVTSPGPVLFRQKRMAGHGRTFTILKFRTMRHSIEAPSNSVTTIDDQRFTAAGLFLRKWKLDEVPQLLNVLFGHMSLVGPRPKVPEQQLALLACRPGITGAATLAFAREENSLACVPKHHLGAFYHHVILPEKRKLDAEYMARATFQSDLKLIVKSLLRRWDDSASTSFPMSAFADKLQIEALPNADLQRTPADHAVRIADRVLSPRLEDDPRDKELFQPTPP